MIINVSIYLGNDKFNTFEIGNKMVINGKPSDVTVEKIHINIFKKISIFLSNGEVLTYRGFPFGTAEKKSEATK